MDKKGLLLIIIFTIFAFDLQAGLKLDALATLERAPLDFAGDMGEMAGTVTDAAAMTKEVIAKGEKAKAFYEKTKLQAQNALETVNSYLPGYEESPEAEITYEEELAAAEETLSQTPSALEIQGKESEMLMEKRKEALYTEAEGKKQAAEENIRILETLAADAKTPEVKRMIDDVIKEQKGWAEDYQADMDDIQSENSQILQDDETYQEHSANKDQTIAKLAGAFAIAKGVFGNLDLSKLEGLMSKSGEEKTAEYSQVIKDNFILPEEKENSETVARVQKNRNQELINSMAKAIVAAAKFKNLSDVSEDKTDQIQDNVMGADQQVSTLGMSTEQKIQETKLLHDYNKLVLANMKLKTALAMKKQDYRLKNYDKDPAVLDLDNYIFTEEDIVTDEGTKSFLDDVKAK